ncbi:hypothetical protein [Komagataeibacter xylinus]|uniref:Uncharacterized protein n=1 Tax=Komagataeibacter xylinus TaxID=28448 RepID=A0A857FPD4_KOMXY|nr:hypothetical protein [Komagataeibacter xylinus]QHC36042.1 hypothetical protein FMA36_11555 [Komagataeibacter xylinus]
MQAFYAALPESGAALTINDRATIALLLRHDVIPVWTWGNFDDPEPVVEAWVCSPDGSPAIAFLKKGNTLMHNITVALHGPVA